MDINSITSYYENEGDEELRLQPGGVQYTEFLTAIKYIEKILPKQATILDACAGTGAYSFHLARRGHWVSAGDLVPHNVDILHEKQVLEPILDDIYKGDIRNLKFFSDAYFDVVLCMGALYHMPQEEQKQVMRESLRLLRPGGIFVGTYMNKHAVILNNAEGSLDNLDEIMQFAKDGKEGIFYAASPGEITELMEQFNIKKRFHVGLDGMGYFMYHTAGLLNEEGFERWREYHFAVCEEESLLGLSYHGMFIGEKTEGMEIK